MDTQKVGVREFRENLSTYLESEAPVAVTRHGSTVGHYFPARPKRTEEQRAAFKEAHDRVQEMLSAAGITEEEIYAEIDQVLLEEKLRRRASR